MHLGTLIARLENEQDATEAIEALGDLVLYAEVVAAGERYDEAPGEYVSFAVARFSGSASEESWLALVTAIEGARDPGRAALTFILRWAIARDGAELDPASAHGACSCGGFASEGSHHDTP